MEEIIVEDKDIGIMYIVKRFYGSKDYALRQFLAEWANVPEETISRKQIENVLRETCMNFILNSDNPEREIVRFFNSYKTPWVCNEYEGLILFLQQAAVRDNKGYINGFKDNPYTHFKIFNRHKGD